MKIFKKLDIVIIISLLVLSFVPYFLFIGDIKNYNSTYVNINVDGKLYDNIPLSSFKGEKEIKIKSDDKLNTLKISNNTIHMLEANCNDSLCIKQGTISKVNQSIICLPHKLIIEIKGDTVDDQIIIPQ